MWVVRICHYDCNIAKCDSSQPRRTSRMWGSRPLIKNDWNDAYWSFEAFAKVQKIKHARLWGNRSETLSQALWRCEMKTFWHLEDAPKQLLMQNTILFTMFQELLYDPVCRGQRTKPVRQQHPIFVSWHPRTLLCCQHPKSLSMLKKQIRQHA